MVQQKSWLPLMAAGLLISGCGGDSGDATKTQQSASPFAPTAEQRSEIGKTIAAYGTADTAKEICAVITRGLEETFRSGGAPPQTPGPAGAPASPKCPQAVALGQHSALVDLTPATLSVDKLLVDGEFAAARVSSPGGKTQPYFLVESDGRWRIDNFGAPPPPYQQLAADLG